MFLIMRTHTNKINKIVVCIKSIIAVLLAQSFLYAYADNVTLFDTVIQVSQEGCNF